MALSYCVGSGDPTQVIKLGGKNFHPLNHLSDPVIGIILIHHYLDHPHCHCQYYCVSELL